MKGEGGIETQNGVGEGGGGGLGGGGGVGSKQKQGVSWRGVVLTWRASTIEYIQLVWCCCSKDSGSHRRYAPSWSTTTAKSHHHVQTAERRTATRPDGSVSFVSY